MLIRGGALFLSSFPRVSIDPLLLFFSLRFFKTRAPRFFEHFAVTSAPDGETGNLEDDPIRFSLFDVDDDAFLIKERAFRPFRERGKEVEARRRRVAITQLREGRPPFYSHSTKLNFCPPRRHVSPKGRDKEEGVTF